MDQERKIKPYFYPNDRYPFKLPDLGWKYTDLEPYIDAMTMEIHHSRHH